MSEEGLYIGREQTLCKHFILRKYLERFAHIVGSFADSITYIDCFSGPWNVRSNELKDSSFSIALEELRKAKTTLANRGRTLKLRCMFLEKEAGPYAKLEEFAKQVQDAEIETRNSELEGSIDEIRQFIRRGGPKTFPFIFIDPTGWTGFAMKHIAPLLQIKPGEVLTNFMTDHIRRFIDHPAQETRQGFADLFGSGDFRAELQGLADPQDREDVLFRAYAESVKKTGDFKYTCAAIVLYPEVDRSYFHLIYATRDRKGVVVFKEAEKRAMDVMARSREEAKQRKRVKKTGQQELFGAEFMPHSTSIDQLRVRYLRQAKQKVLQILQTEARVPYETVWEEALSQPLVWDSDLKDWIKDWKREGLLKIEGMLKNQRVPKLNEKNILVWQALGQGRRRV
jgi:three-Cys-motif partner protein